MAVSVTAVGGAAESNQAFCVRSVSETPYCVIVLYSGVLPNCAKNPSIAFASALGLPCEPHSEPQKIETTLADVRTGPPWLMRGWPPPPCAAGACALPS